MIVTVLLLQTAVTLLLVFLRSHSAKRTLSSPPKGVRPWLQQQLGHGKIVGGPTWNTGALKRELLKHWAKRPCLYSGDDILAFDNNEEVDHLKQLCKNLTVSEQQPQQHSKNSKTIWGFFHPYCNAGGGGEKVLWKAVETTLNHDLDNIVVIYTGDIGIDRKVILDNVIKRFDYKLEADRIVFIFLKKRWLVDSVTWPYLTLLGQALGSIILTIEAILKCPPDIWCDTMGYPFGYPFVAHLLRIPIITYTHYPIISNDMLNKLKLSTHMNPGKKFIKLLYWKTFMWSYKHIGSYISIALTNSTWTNNHIKKIWSQTSTKIIYPPCSTEKLAIRDNENDDSRGSRGNFGIVIAQFRPEKRHDLIIESYAQYYNSRIDYSDSHMETPILTLIFIGSTRSQSDKDYVHSLKKLCRDYKIPDDNIEFLLDVPYDEIKKQLYRATYGINAMWNEHFGIAVVEYIASGLIPLVHASAGPYLDIVGDKVGFFFKDSSDPDYVDTKEEKFPTLTNLFEITDRLSEQDKLSRSKQGIKDALTKFSDEQFDINWIDNVMHKFEN